MQRRLIRMLETLLEPVALRALISWPKFSFTSFRMVHELRRQGISAKTVIDVGANVGQFAIAAAMLFPDARIYSFEPHPGCFEHLVKNAARLPRIKPIQAALGERAGVAQLRINSHSHSSSLMPLAQAHRQAFPSAVEVQTLGVRQTTLDAVFGAIELETPVLLKLDVQGYEAQAVRGGREMLKRVQWMVSEASLKPMYEGEVLFMGLVRLMEDEGFSFSRPVGFLNDPQTGEILQLDALFTRNAIAKEEL
ncbi:MAG TPA: FkbM family methyltransferase [Candidatus Binataceae bacterium]|nr:FkbM family methyltransferase [Candidatus Binataceae bacterium]